MINISRRSSYFQLSGVSAANFNSWCPPDTRVLPRMSAVYPRLASYANSNCMLPTRCGQCCTTASRSPGPHRHRAPPPAAALGAGKYALFHQVASDWPTLTHSMRRRVFAAMWAPPQSGSGGSGAAATAGVATAGMRQNRHHAGCTLRHQQTCQMYRCRARA